MANVTNLRYGSTGEDVKKLQKALGFTGSDVDGIFGKKTEAAVRNYQQSNGLTVDGIAGVNTQGKLYATNTPATGTAGGTSAAGNAGNTAAGNAAKAETITTDLGFTYGTFTESDDTAAKGTKVDEHWNDHPGDYTWGENYNKATGYLDQYQNRDPFSYDFNSDALYNLYKDQYIQQGQMAMMDAMGQAAALTGGYGSSYAQSVGQQTYNQYLTQLNNIIPDLYSMAYDRYTQEGQDMLKMYDAYLGLEKMDYDKHMDDVDIWYKDHSIYTDEYNTSYDREWDEYATNLDIQHSDHTTLKQQEFTERENQKQRDWETEENTKQRNFTAGENDKTRTANKQTAYREYLTNLILTTGYIPKQNELIAAGMDQEEARALYNVYKEGQNDKLTTEQKEKRNEMINEMATYGTEYSDEECIANGISLDLKKSILNTFNGGDTDDEKKNLNDTAPADPEPTYKFSTYNEAVASLENSGYGDNTSGLMTNSEWSRRKNNGGTGNEVTLFDTYQEYLEYYVDYASTPLKDLDVEEWELVDDGGWYTGEVDDNATVKDPFGNVYRLDDLIDKFESEGMSKKDAKNRVISIQNHVGA